MYQESISKDCATAQQKQAILASTQGRSVKIIGHAGTGKTSTLGMISEELGKRGLRGLYLAHKKHISDNVKEFVGEAVSCRTLYSIAYVCIPQYLKDKVGNPRDSFTELAKLYQIKPSVSKYSRKYSLEVFYRSEKAYTSLKKNEFSRNLSSHTKFQIVHDAIMEFCQSDDESLEEKHFIVPLWADTTSYKAIVEEMLPIAKKHWSALISPENKLSVSPDVYLKFWVMKGQAIPQYNYILVDNIQNATPLMRFFLSNQKKPIFYTEDALRSDGYNDLLPIVNNPMEVRLTQSQRFGNEISAYGNSLLCLLGQDTLHQGNGSGGGEVLLDHKMDVRVQAILCRTDIGACTELVHQVRANPDRTFALKADKKKIKKWLEALESIWEGKKTFHPDFIFFNDWKGIVDYIQMTYASNEFRNIGYLVGDLDFNFQEIYDILDRVDSNPHGVDTVICTVEQSKGKEWDSVLLSNDFHLSLMSHKFLNIDRGIKNYHEGDDYVENWSIYEFPSTMKLSLSTFDKNSVICDLNEIKSILPTKEQRYRITSMNDYELELIHLAITRSRKRLYVGNFAEFFILVKQLEENLD